MIALDKVAHALAGAVVAALALPFGDRWAVAAITAAAVGKEAYDAWANRRARAQGLLAPHTVDAADAGWTVLGGLLMAGALKAVGLLAT